jgi:hypothetical protein
MSIEDHLKILLKPVNRENINPIRIYSLISLINLAFWKDELIRNSMVITKASQLNLFIAFPSELILLINFMYVNIQKIHEKYLPGCNKSKCLLSWIEKMKQIKVRKEINFSIYSAQKRSLLDFYLLHCEICHDINTNGITYDRTCRLVEKGFICDWCTRTCCVKCFSCVEPYTIHKYNYICKFCTTSRVDM